MNFRDVMKNPKEPERGGQEEFSSFGKSLQELMEESARFEKIYFETLEAVKGYWDIARKGRLVPFKNVLADAEKITGFLAEKKEGINLFKTAGNVAYYYLNVVNVAWIAAMMGRELGFAPPDLARLTAAALLHDIGMSKLPESLLNKADKLSFSEYETIRQHPEEGRKIISAGEGIPNEVAMGVFQEHERENGSGYPEGKRAGQIHEYAKIIGLADVFEAMTHPRSYRLPITPYEAIMELVDMKNRLFPDRLIKVFINLFTFYPVGGYVQLNTGEIGVVARVSRNFPTRPTIEVLVDKEGNAVKKPFLLKLTDENLIYVKETLTENRVREALGEKA